MDWLTPDVQTVLIALVVLLSVWLYRSTRLPRGFPPGPRPWPIIGNLGVMGQDPKHTHKVLAELAKQYGPVVGMKLGYHPTIVLSNYDVIKEAIVKKADAFSHRPEFLYILTKIATRGGSRRGIILSDGQPWKVTRRFSLMALRDFGLGKRSIEERIQEEGGAMSEEIQKAAGKPFDIASLSQQAVSNVICSICFGSRFEYTDTKFLHILELVNYNLSSNINQNPGNFFPWLRFLPFLNIKHILDNVTEAEQWVDQLITQHRQTFDPDNIRDFVDLYLQKEQEGNSGEGSIGTDDMHRIIADLFVAGTETTSTALRWLVLFMVRYPEIQKKCQDEIDDVIGSSRPPSVTDRTKVPYVDATIHEMMRVGNVAALSVPHKTEKETTVAGFVIPRNTMVIMNTYAVHIDPAHWDDPEAFNPDRWLGADGKVQKKEAFMPFSVGPRACAGQSLAENESFMLFVMLLQRFKLKMVDPSHPPPLEGNLGVTLAPETYQFIAEPRL